MPKPPRAAHLGPESPRRRSRARLTFGVVIAIALVTVAASALGASSALTLGSASNSTLGKPVVVNPQGRTLYRLSPETSKHLLCKSKECLTNWPPVLVKSAKGKVKAGSGVKGKLGVFRRSNGTFQVTLNGLPLYRYAGDSGKDEANGEGIESFGGTWHAVRAASAPSATPPTTTGTTTTQSAPPPEPYKY